MHPIEAEGMMAYLDGELSAERSEVAATHLENCAECRQLAADMRMVSQGMLAWQVEESGARCPEVGPARHAWRIRPWMWGLATACMVVLLVVVMMMMPVRYNRMGSPAGPPLQVFMSLEKSAAPHSAPMIARTANLNLSTREFDRIRPALDGILERHHGYLGNLNVVTARGAAPTLNAALRVPSGELGATLDELKKLGRVESEQQSGEEVTEKYVDLSARLTNARNTESRLTDILRQRTGKLSDVLDVEKELARVRGEIEQMDAEKKALTARVDFAAVSLTVTEERAASGSIGEAVREGWRNMVASVVGVALFAAAIGPTVLLWGAILFLPARFAWRRLRVSVGPR